jgi:elongation factor 2
MVNFSIEQIREIMFNPDCIRNMSVIAHVDHGKSTLTDSLIAKAGIIAMKSAGDERYMDTRDDEKERGITIKSTGVSLYFDLKEEGTDKKTGYLFNLIDSPGHVDFSSEVTAALRVTDGALVVVDAVEGVCVQTETVLRQAMQEKIRPVLFVNKVDRNILELQVDGEVMYQNFVKTMENVNIIVGTYESEDMGSLEINPIIGNVAFGSGKDCWAFTLGKFAALYSTKMKIEKEKLVERLWGDNFYDAKAKVWRKEGTDGEGKNIPRAFAQFIMDPIITIARAAMQNDKEKLKGICTKMDIHLTPQEWELTYKELNKTLMQRWINAADCILEMMIFHLPSPRVAQKYRYAYLYEGEKDDAAAIAIRDCDVNGPLMMYISKMVPSSDKGRFFAYGRVFSGKAITGQKVRMLGPNYKPGKKIDVYSGNIQRTVLMMGRKTEFVPDIPCGNTGALVGVDKYLTKTGTITDSEEAHNIRSMKYSVSPVVRVAITPKNPADLPKVIEGMRRLSKSDPLVVCISDEQTGQNIIAGSGELHVEICINDLQNEYAQVEIIRSNPIVSYNETVTEKGEQCMSKSANKHNRLYCSAEPLHADLATEIEAGRITLNMDKKELTKTLATDYGFDKNEVAKIWAFGPNDDGPNMIVDVTSGCQFMNEIKDSCVTGFNVVTANGVLCDEPCRAIRFNVHDTNLHPDGIHRGGGQIIPVARQSLYGCELLAAPRLQEPIFLVEITCPNDVVGTVYNVIAMRRGNIEEETMMPGAPITIIKGFLPVSESFGKFDPNLRFHRVSES